MAFLAEPAGLRDEMEELQCIHHKLCVSKCICLCVWDLFVYDIHTFFVHMIMWCLYVFVLHVICGRVCVWCGHQIKQCLPKCLLPFRSHPFGIYLCKYWIEEELWCISTFHWGSRLLEDFSFVVMTSRVHVMAVTEGWRVVMKQGQLQGLVCNKSGCK